MVIVIIQRFLEIFGCEMGLAAAFSLMVRLEIIKSTTFSNVIMASVSILLILVFYAITLRSFLIEVSNEPRVYLGINLTLVLILVISAIIMASINPEPYYTILFMPFKLLSYMSFNKVLSAAAVGTLFVAQVFLMPYIGIPEEAYLDEMDDGRRT